jgi:hypothetical protein
MPYLLGRKSGHYTVAFPFDCGTHLKQKKKVFNLGLRRINKAFEMNWRHLGLYRYIVQKHKLKKLSDAGRLLFMTVWNEMPYGHCYWILLLNDIRKVQENENKITGTEWETSLSRLYQWQHTGWENNTIMRNTEVVLKWPVTNLVQK